MARNDGIPDEKSWGDYRSDLDWEYSHKRFAGKTIKQVMQYFYDSVLSAQEDLSNMPPVPFQYYIFAFTEYLTAWDLSDREAMYLSEAPDGASSFLRLVRNKLKNSPDTVARVLDELMPTAEYVAARQQEFCADQDIYGSFEDLLQEIQELREPKKY